MKISINYFYLIITFLISCSGSKSDINEPTLTEASYSFSNELVWSDEFNDDGKISEDKWNIETIAPNNGSWWNGEFQYYTDREQNIKIEEGLLKISALKEGFNSKAYTSARINTQDKFEFTYGKVEMRAKLPKGEGMWPAFWLLGASYDEVGWPKCGEIDILEHGDFVKDTTSNNPGLISSAMHYSSNDHKSVYSSIPNTIFIQDDPHNFVRAEKIITNPFDEFHIYSLEWTPTKLIFSIDEDEYFEFPLTNNSYPFDEPFFLILNLAVGGHWTDYYVDPEFTQATFEIDYVRVYQ